MAWRGGTCLHKLFLPEGAARALSWGNVGAGLGGRFQPLLAMLTDHAEGHGTAPRANRPDVPVTGGTPRTDTRKVINRAHLATGFGRLRLHGDSALSDAWVYPFTFPTKTPVFVEA